MVPRALERLRVARQMDRSELAKKAGLGVRTIELWESPRPPKTMARETLRRLAKALESPQAALARWVPYGGGEAAPPLDDEERLPAIVTSTLSRLAEEARAAGAAGLTVTVPSGTYPLLGPSLFEKCDKAHGRYRDQRLAVVGHVKSFDHLPARACEVLRVRVGDGAKFLITRTIKRGNLFYSTVFTRDLDSTVQLQDYADQKTRVIAVVRVFDAPQKDDWKGFFVFERTSRERKSPRPRPYAFVVEEVHADRGE
jgi:transcriptional regulator with XRE-family HTH domain